MPTAWQRLLHQEWTSQHARGHAVVATPRSAGKVERTAFNSPFWPFVLASTDVGQEGLDFHSYTHDNAAHVELVRQLGEFLCECGIDTHMDRWNLDERRNWNLWAIRNIRAADFVLVIASPLCKAVGDGEVDNKVNRGMQSELAVLADKQHTDRETWTRKLLPVVLPPYTADDLPDFLQPRSADHYKVPTITREGAESLLRTITRQPRFTRPRIATELITSADRRVFDQTIPAPVTWHSPTAGWLNTWEALLDLSAGMGDSWIRDFTGAERPAVWRIRPACGPMR